MSVHGRSPFRQGVGHSGQGPPPVSRSPKGPIQGWSQCFAVLAYGTGAQMPPVPGGRSRPGNQLDVPHLGPIQLELASSVRHGPYPTPPPGGWRLSPWYPAAWEGRWHHPHFQ